MKQKQLEDLRFSEEQKAAMVEQLMAGTRPEPRRVRRRGPLVAAVAALLALALCGAGYAGVFSSASQALAGLFGGEPAQTETLDQLGQPLNLSRTQNGVTITARAYIADGSSYAVLFDVTREDGAPLLEDPAALPPWGNGGLPLRFRDLDADQRGNNSSRGYGVYFYDEDPGEPSLQGLMTCVHHDGMGDGTLSIQMKDLQRMENGQAAEQWEGRWHFSFRPEGQDLSVSLEAGQQFPWTGETLTGDTVTQDITLEKVVLSPLSLEVVYSARARQEDRPETQRVILPITLTLTDGTVLEVGRERTDILVRWGSPVQWITRFQPVLPVEQVASVTVGAATLPVP